MNSLSRWLAVPALLAVLSVGAGAQGDAKPDLAGKWSFTVVYEGGQGSPTVTISHLKGDTLAVTYSSQAFGELQGDGLLTDKGFQFWITTSAGGDPFTMTFTGTFEGKDALKGSVELGGNGMATFTARRLSTPGDRSTG